MDIKSKKTMLEQYSLRLADVNLLYSYVKKVGLNTQNVDGEVVNESYCRLLFSEILKDYQAFKLSIHDLSSLCELMWQKSDDFSYLLLEGAEINWYLRKSPQDAVNAINDLINEFGTKETK